MKWLCVKLWMVMCGAGEGMKEGILWYMETIKNNKWFMILFVIDMVLMPVKILLVMPLLIAVAFMNDEQVAKFYENATWLRDFER